jgi:hypothetical protein
LSQQKTLALEEFVASKKSKPRYTNTNTVTHFVEAKDHEECLLHIVKLLKSQDIVKPEVIFFRWCKNENFEHVCETTVITSEEE